MSSFNWKSFLKQWSQEFLKSKDDQKKLPPGVIQSGWLGNPGATQEQIARIETRLGTTLPPSYQEFLKITNGWGQTTPFIHQLWSTEKIEWFSVRHQGWINSFVEIYSDYYPIADEEYFVYGDEQDCSKIRVEYLQTALEISNIGDSVIYLLNPQAITTRRIVEQKLLSLLVENLRSLFCKEGASLTSLKHP